MSEAPPRAWHFYVDDMLAFASNVLRFTEGLDQAAFEASALHRDATLRNIELIGEAATRIPEEVRQHHPQIPWRKIIATRNRLIHAYLGIDADVVWSIVKDDVPALMAQLKLLKAGASGAG
jgi:uncharacterized protein with HEPN domain